MEHHKCFITGITGFAGSHLADYLLTQPEVSEVYGLVRCTSTRENVVNARLRLLEGDLQDYSSILAALETTRPGYIFHLASKTYVAYSYTNPMTFLQDNCVGTLHLLEAIRYLRARDKYDPVLHICSSSEVYGKVEEHELPISESNALRPMSPYAVSKAAEELYARQYYYSWGIRTVISRAFSHTGPRRNPVFAISGFCKQVVEIERKLCAPIVQVGNLDSVRTFCDVRDMVRAYWLLVQAGKYGEIYNICGRDTVSIRTALQMIYDISGVHPVTVVDESRLRPSDVVVQRPSCSRFSALTCWHPTITLEDTIRDLLEYWRRKITSAQIISESRSYFANKLASDPVLAGRCAETAQVLRNEARDEIAAIERSEQLTNEDFAVYINARDDNALGGKGAP